MRVYLQLALISIISLFSLSVQAEDQPGKKFSIGLGTYALTLYYDDSTLVDDEFSGIAISASYAFTDNVAVKGTYYSMDHDYFGALEASGIDLAVVGGTGLATNGFKIYGGGGIFNETLELSGFSDVEKFSGIQLVGGLGYNWDVVAVDLSLALRDADDYADFVGSVVGGTGTVTARVIALTVSVRL